MNSARNTARVAGFLYLLIGITAPFGLMYVPAKLIVRGDATATASNILASQLLFRFGVVSQLVCSVVFVFLVMTLYRLLKEVNQHHASLMVIFVLVQVPITFLNEVSALTSLQLMRGAGFLSAFEKPQRDALAMLFLNLHSQGIIVNELFWGVWLLPFGLLVYRSGFFPRFLGAWLIVNGFAYMAISFTGLLLPPYYNAASNYALPALFGEAAMFLYLLTVGAKPQPMASSSATA